MIDLRRGRRDIDVRIDRSETKRGNIDVRLDDRSTMRKEGHRCKNFLLLFHLFHEPVSPLKVASCHSG